MEKHLLWQSWSMTFNWTFRKCLLFRHKAVWNWTDLYSTPWVKWSVRYTASKMLLENEVMTSELCVSSINRMELNWFLLYALIEVICTMCCKRNAALEIEVLKNELCIFDSSTLWQFIGVWIRSVLWRRPTTMTTTRRTTPNDDHRGLLRRLIDDDATILMMQEKMTDEDDD